jgi:hypothetical protein
MPATLTDLLERLTPETLALAYRDVTEVDDILTDDLALAIFAQLEACVGVDKAVEMLDLVGAPAP